MRKSIALILLAITVAVVISTTGCRSGVPDVVGMRQADAVRTLQEAGYKLGNVTLVATDTVQLGMIAAQAPAAGERAKDGSAVDLAVSFSDGKRVLVPVVAGLTQVTAEGVADTLRLTPLIVEQYSSSVAKGIVASQSPEPNAQVGVGSVLVMVVSKGDAPAKAKVPGVTGKSEADADAALASAGFPSETFKVYNSTVPKGKVIAQLPEAGSSAVVGSTVQIVVSLGKGTGSAKMPSVTGKKEADAISAIQSAGLKAKKVTQYSSSVAKGVVSEQFPAAGAATAAGSEALIVVSLGAEPAGTVAVPNVVGQPETEASSILQDAGFAVAVESAASDAAVGTVVFQFPSSAEKATSGSEVLIVVAAAAAP